MARKDRLPVDGASEHTPGDPVRISGGDARRGGRSGAGNGIRNRVFVSGKTSGSHGRSWPASAVSGRMVTRHNFLFPGLVLLLQDAHVEKNRRHAVIAKMSARRRLKYYFRFISKQFFSLLPSLFLGLFFLNYYLSCGQARDRNTERRSADVVHADLVAELHALCIATMLAADADLELGSCLAPLFDAPAHQHADALDIERLERIRQENTGFLLVYVIRQEAAGVVAGETHCGLSEVIGPEREELRHFGDLSGEQSGAGKFDHRANEIVELDSGLFD